MGIILNGSSSLGNSLTYEWRKNQVATIIATTANLTVTTAGDYELTVIDGVNGLTHFTTVTVTDSYGSPTVNITAPITNITQTGQVLTLTATAGLSYLWSTAETTQSININSAGTYSVTGTSISNGCSASDNVTITENIADLTVSITEPNGLALNCDVTSLTINASVVDAVGTISYEWWDMDAIQLIGVGGVITISQEGSYQVIASDSGNGNTSTEAFVITGSNFSSPPTASISGPIKLSCLGPITLDGSGSSGVGTLTYEWWDQDTIQLIGTNSTISISQPGTYQLIVRNGLDNGCTDSAIHDVADAYDPFVTIQTTSLIIPAGGTSTLSATISGTGPFTYLWTAGNGATIVGGSPQSTTTIDATTGGEYELLITDAVGCTTNKIIVLSDEVVSDTQPPSNVINLQANVIGNTDQIALTWSPASDNFGVNHYQVWVSQNGGAYYEEITHPTGTSYTDTNLNHGDTYCYKVKAVDDAGNVSTSFSNIACDTPFLDICEAFDVRLDGQGGEGSLFITDCDGNPQELVVSNQLGQGVIDFCSMTTPVVNGDLIVGGPYALCQDGSSGPTCYNYELIAEGGYGDVFYEDCNGVIRNIYMDGTDIFGFPERETRYVCSIVTPTTSAWQGNPAIITKQNECV